MRPLLSSLLLLLAPAPALAGGVGILLNGGGHGDRVYSQTADATGQYEENDPENQINPNFGGGIEVVLGDKDNRVLGIFRGYYLQDAPQQEPSEGEVKVFRETPRNIGVVTAGLQWGIVGDPTGLQLIAVANLGGGVFTSDKTEYLLGEAGVGGSYMMGRRLQFTATANGGVRFRKLVYPSVNAYLGARYMFD